jgi:hypothetical protein
MIEIGYMIGAAKNPACSTTAQIYCTSLKYTFNAASPKEIPRIIKNSTANTIGKYMIVIEGITLKNIINAANTTNSNSDINKAVIHELITKTSLGKYTFCTRLGLPRMLFKLMLVPRDTRFHETIPISKNNW